MAAVFIYDKLWAGRRLDLVAIGFGAAICVFMNIRFVEVLGF